MNVRREGPAAVLVAACFVLSGGSGAAGPADLEAGKAVFVDQCQSCHGDKGQGNAKSYKKVNAKVVHLGSKEAQDKTDQFIRDSIVKGWGKMEKCDEVTPDQIDKVIAFVRSL